MAKFFCIGVHSSIGLKKGEHYFVYKGVQCSYRSGYSEGDTDAFNGRFGDGTSEEECYRHLTEFLSAFAFSSDARLIPDPGMSTNLSCSIADFKGSYGARREIPVDQVMDQFWLIPPIMNEDQATLARLYREARAASNNYLGALFFWHALVFPSKDDRAAVEYIDKLTASPPEELQFNGDSIERVQQNPIFAPGAGPLGDIGAYLREGVRNSIAHIVRDRPNTRNIQLAGC